MRKLTLLLIFLAPLTICAQEQKKPEPLRSFCTVISIEPDKYGVAVMLDCVDEEGKPLFNKPLRAFNEWNLENKHLNPGISTLVLEETPGKICVVHINIMGGETKEPVNQKHECVELRRKKRGRK
jgi:hypothetical protein